ncbi:MAG TPA: hypothetical protein VHB98_09490 [Chloroflexota bacterium]|nr:hypothetical protein [Chloroflexota bacterium]
MLPQIIKVAEASGECPIGYADRQDTLPTGGARPHVKQLVQHWIFVHPGQLALKQLQAEAAVRDRKIVTLQVRMPGASWQYDHIPCLERLPPMDSEVEAGPAADQYEFHKVVTVQLEIALEQHAVRRDRHVISCEYATSRIVDRAYVLIHARTFAATTLSLLC